MENRQLKSFITVAKFQNFSLAAKELGYAQSTVTTQIQMLEQELGVRLFERLGHKIALTSKGHRLLPYAEQILKLAGEAKAAMDDSELLKGVLTIGVVESLCVLRLPRLLQEYRVRYPEVEIALKFGEGVDFIRAMRENTMDTALFLEADFKEAGFMIERKFPEKMVVLAAADHPLSKQERVGPADLTNETLILTEPGCSYRRQFETILRQHGIKPRSIMETGNVQAIKQLTMSGLGIAVLPFTAVTEECKEGRLTVLNWSGSEFHIFTYVVHHKDKWISGPLKAFLQLLRETDW